MIEDVQLPNPIEVNLTESVAISAQQKYSISMTALCFLFEQKLTNHPKLVDFFLARKIVCCGLECSFNFYACLININTNESIFSQDVKQEARPNEVNNT